jgi:hypothetical protein
MQKRWVDTHRFFYPLYVTLKLFRTFAIQHLFETRAGNAAPVSIAMFNAATYE